MRRAIPLLLTLASACITAALLEHATAEPSGPGPAKRGVIRAGPPAGFAALDGDGARDDTAPLQALIGEAVRSGRRLNLSPGVFTVSRTLKVERVSGLVITGAGSANGRGGTVFHWAGNATDPMFDVVNCNRCTFEDFTINCSPAKPLAVGIRSRNQAGGSVTPLENRYHRVNMDGTTNGLGVGWEMARGPGDSDANNDFSVWDGCTVSNYANTAWSLEHSQCLGNTFRDCLFRANSGGGRYGVDCSRGGGFHWYGGGGCGNTAADFRVGTWSDAFVIDGFNGENSARLLELPGPTGAFSPVKLCNIRWAHAGMVARDGAFVRFNGTGPLTLENVRVEDKDGSVPLVIEMAPGGPAYGQLLLQGLYVETSAPRAGFLRVRGTGRLQTSVRGVVLYDKSRDRYEVLGDPPPAQPRRADR